MVVALVLPLIVVPWVVALVLPLLVVPQVVALVVVKAQEVPSLVVAKAQEVPPPPTFDLGWLRQRHEPHHHLGAPPAATLLGLLLPQRWWA